MILKSLIIRYWPALRLRTIIFGILLFVAALPGFGALYLRVYENALVRQTEAEVRAIGVSIAQGAALGWDRPAGSAHAPLAAMRPHLFAAINVESIPILPDAAPHAPLFPAEPQVQRYAAAQTPLFAEIERQIGASLMVLDSHGVIAYGHGAGEVFDQPLELKIALGGLPATVLRRDDRDPPHWLVAQFSKTAGTLLIHSEPVIVQGRVVAVVVVAKPPQSVLTSIWLDRYSIGLGVILILAVLVVLTLTLARAIVRPIERLSAAARGVATGRGKVPDNPSLRVVEINALYDEYRAMSATIAARATYLRDFAAALSHEFKTPLTGLCGGIELLQDHGAEMDGAAHARFLGNMAGDTARLTHLLSRLMELAKADLQYPDGQACCEVGDVLKLVADGLRATDFTITIAPGKGPRAAIDPASMERVATILIENARQAGATTMSITAEVTTDQFALRLADTGPGVPDADTTRIFEPFFTSKRTSGGTGLGLAIARSLIEAHGGNLSLINAATGTCFLLILPIALLGSS